MSAWWSWALAIAGFLGTWLAGKKLAIGWLVRAGAQLIWLPYAVITRQWGFVATSVVFFAVYGRNWLLWRDQDRPEDGWNEEAA